MDLGLPDADGIKVIRAVRGWSPVPIVVLSARTMESQKIEALDAGADDYVTKPFSAPELLARVRAALRRNVRSAEQVPNLQIGAIEIDLARRQAVGTGGRRALHAARVSRAGESGASDRHPIAHAAAAHQRGVGPDKLGDTRSLRVCIKNLRQKLEPDPAQPQYLLTEAGVGYRLLLPAE